MAYTVKQVSEISGVTARTLRFYEEQGLLEPAYYGSNGYRYYEEEELLQLQQILFFKELGFKLQQIRKVLGKSDFDQLAALYSHKRALSQEWAKLGCLLKTIDKTIAHIKGKKQMRDREFFDGFSLVKRAGKKESYYQAETIALKSLKSRSESMPEKEKREAAKEANALYAKIADCLEKGLKIDSQVVQQLIEKHYQFAARFYNVSKSVYKALAELYSEHPEYKKQLEPIHPGLAIFMAEAMRVFADKELS